MVSDIAYAYGIVAWTLAGSARRWLRNLTDAHERGKMKSDSDEDTGA